MSVVGSKDGYLMLMTGTNVSSGIPSNAEWPFLEEPNTILYNRNIEHENQGKNEPMIDFAIDVKAHSNGNYWRFIGHNFMIITYSEVSEETAREFDDILDTLCYSPPTVKRSQ